MDVVSLNFRIQEAETKKGKFEAIAIDCTA